MSQCILSTLRPQINRASNETLLTTHENYGRMIMFILPQDMLGVHRPARVTPAVTHIAHPHLFVLASPWIRR